MGKSRLEAFSDGVIAVIITIMVLELKVPHGLEISALTAKLPTLVTYMLSFVVVGIYWNNHHHLFQAVHKIDGRVMWANLHLLFWLSLIPFVTGYVGENHFAPLPAALYGVVGLMCGIAYFILVRMLVSLHGNESVLAKAIGSDFKGLISLALYAAAIPLSFVDGVLGFGVYVLVALIWFAPDRRIEKHVAK